MWLVVVIALGLHSGTRCRSSAQVLVPDRIGDAIENGHATCGRRVLDRIHGVLGSVVVAEGIENHAGFIAEGNDARRHVLLNLLAAAHDASNTAVKTAPRHAARQPAIQHA